MEEHSRETAFHVSTLREGSATTADTLPNSVDEITGLPGLKKAEERIKELVRAGKGCYAFVFFLERMDTINKRFGFAIGDEILKSFSQATQQRLTSSDQLFRWRGPCFLGLLDRASGFDAVRSDVNKLASARMEHTVENNGRSILLSLSRAWTLIQISPGEDAGAVLRKIDAFASEQSRLSTLPR